MKRSILTIALALILALSLATAVQAESISISGTVTSKGATPIYAPIGGTVSEVLIEAGQTVSDGDTIAKLRTEKVYAEEAGTVRGVFGEPGDNAETVGTRYGAVLYIEGAAKYTVTASTENAYSSTATKFVHVGEKVYIKNRSTGTRKGVGQVTAVEGIEFTVEITQGDFLLEESVDIYRSESFVTSTRIGRGDIARKTPTAVAGTGSIVSMAVADGDAVTKGQLLFETLSGTYDGCYATGSEIVADVDGVVSQVQAEAGSQLEKGGVVATVWTKDSMRVEATIPEGDLANVTVGEKVTIELIWNQDSDVTYPGVITGISSSAQEAAGEESEEASYTVWIDFTPDENTRFGMSAVVTTGAEEAYEEAAPEEEAAEDEAFES